MRLAVLSRRGSRWALAVAALCLGCGTHVLLNMREVTLSEKVHLFVGGFSNSLVLSGADGAFLTDAKMGNFTREMHATIGTELGLQVSRLMLTHSHDDHVQGLPQFKEARAVIVHPRTRARLEASGQVGAPWVEVDQNMRLWLAGEDVSISYFGRGHTDGDLVALLPRERILVTGDLYVQGFAPIIDVSVGGSAVEFETTVGKLLELDFDTVLPGHGEPVKRAELERFHRYLKDMKDQVRAGVAQGWSEDQVATNVPLADYSDYGSLLGISSREKNVRQMYRELKEAATRTP